MSVRQIAPFAINVAVFLTGNFPSNQSKSIESELYTIISVQRDQPKIEMANADGTDRQVADIANNYRN